MKKSLLNGNTKFAEVKRYKWNPDYVWLYFILNDEKKSWSYLHAVREIFLWL